MDTQLHTLKRDGDTRYATCQHTVFSQEGILQPATAGQPRRLWEQWSQHSQCSRSLENTEIRRKMMIDEVDFADMCCVSLTEHTARHAGVEREHKEEWSKHFLSSYKYRERDVCIDKYIYILLAFFLLLFTLLQVHICVVYERERERESHYIYIVLECLSHSDLCN